MSFPAPELPARLGRWIIGHRCALGSVVLVAVLWWLLLPWKSNAATWCEAFGWVDFYREIGDGLIGRTIGESLWLFPVIEVVHLFGLAVLGGSVIVMDLRLLGVGLPECRTCAGSGQHPAVVLRGTGRHDRNRGAPVPLRDHQVLLQPLL